MHIPEIKMMFQIDTGTGSRLMPASMAIMGSIVLTAFVDSPIRTSGKLITKSFDTTSFMRSILINGMTNDKTDVHNK